MRSDHQLRILFLASNPEATSRLDLEEELRGLEYELRGVRFRESVTLTPSHAVRPDDLVRLLRTEAPTVVHFSGHGSRGGIILRTDTGQVAVPGEALERLFRDRGVDLVVLNACFSQDQALPLSSVVPAVVGTSAAVGDEAARRFTTAFYRTLGNGYSVKEAFRDGGDAVAIHTLEDVFLAYGDLERVLCGPPASAEAEEKHLTGSALATTSDLVKILTRLSKDEKLVFRAILKSSESVHKNVFREFFRASNRVGGVQRDGYLFRIVANTGLNRRRVVQAIERLRDEGLIDQEQLTDVHFFPTAPVVAIVNRSPKMILGLLYTQREIDAPTVEVFFGSTRYKDGKPDYYTDMDETPLEGAFRLDEESDVVTRFRAGRVLPEG